MLECFLRHTRTSAQAVGTRDPGQRGGSDNATSEDGQRPTGHRRTCAQPPPRSSVPGFEVLPRITPLRSQEGGCPPGAAQLVTRRITPCVSAPAARNLVWSGFKQHSSTRGTARTRVVNRRHHRGLWSVKSLGVAVQDEHGIIHRSWAEYGKNASELGVRVLDRTHPAWSGRANARLPLD